MPTLVIQPGRIVVTSGALEHVTPERMSACLRRHVSGDWGALDAEDIASNDAAAEEGRRVLSAYPIDPALPSLGYTEADRSTTTFLLPSEY